MPNPAPGPTPANELAPVRTTIDPDEVAKFSAIADSWWDPNGKFKPLHKINPTRLRFIKEHAIGHFDLPNTAKALDGLSVLDIGTGGGLLAEPLTRLGAKVTGLDASEKNIKTASIHAESQGLDIDYRCGTAEALASSGVQFDLVLNMEVIEHVADVELFMDAACQLVKPGGMTVVATLNRTAKSYAFAILGAEYVLRWLPRGTHDWQKFLKPSEIATHLRRNQLEVEELAGMNMNPLSGQWSLSATDMDVNYLMTATKPA